MKFSSLVFVSATLAIGLVDANQKIPIVDKRLDNKAKSSLLRSARPYNEATRKKLLQRKLNDNQDGEVDGDVDGEADGQDYADFEITDRYSVQFRQCVSVPFEYEFEDRDKELEKYAEKGYVVPSEFYVVFNVCKTGNCKDDQNKDKMEFVTDIGSYLTAFAQATGTQELYCAACQNNANYCDAYFAAQNQQDAGDICGDGANDGENDGERRLKESLFASGSRRKLDNDQVVEIIDCETCSEYRCFDDSGNYDYDADDAMEYLYDLMQCEHAGGAQWNGMEAYAGLACSSDGRGVQVGVFFDDECTVYGKGLSYKNYMDGGDLESYVTAEQTVESTFSTDYDCAQQEVTYITECDEVDGDGNAQQDGEQDGDAEDDGNSDGASEYCQTLFSGNYEVLDKNGEIYDYMQKQSAEGLSGGAIAAIILGVLALALGGALIWYSRSRVCSNKNLQVPLMLDEQERRRKEKQNMKRTTTTAW